MLVPEDLPPRWPWPVLHGWAWRAMYVTDQVAGQVPGEQGEVAHEKRRTKAFQRLSRRRMTHKHH